MPVAVGQCAIRALPHRDMTQPTASDNAQPDDQLCQYPNCQAPRALDRRNGTTTLLAFCEHHCIERARWRRSATVPAENEAAIALTLTAIPSARECQELFESFLADGALLELPAEEVRHSSEPDNDWSSPMVVGTSIAFAPAIRL